MFRLPEVDFQWLEVSLSRQIKRQKAKKSSLFHSPFAFIDAVYLSKILLRQILCLCFDFFGNGFLRFVGDLLDFIFGRSQRAERVDGGHVCSAPPSAEVDCVCGALDPKLTDSARLLPS